MQISDFLRREVDEEVVVAGVAVLGSPEAMLTEAGLSALLRLCDGGLPHRAAAGLSGTGGQGRGVLSR